TAHSSIVIREGIIVEITTEQGIVGVGEIAPLPEFAGSTLAAAHSALKTLSAYLHGKTLEEALKIVGAAGLSMSRYERGGHARTTLCGLEIALLDALGKTQGVEVSKLLAPTHANIHPHIPVNAVIGARSI